MKCDRCGKPASGLIEWRNPLPRRRQYLTGPATHLSLSSSASRAIKGWNQKPTCPKKHVRESPFPCGKHGN